MKINQQSLANESLILTADASMQTFIKQKLQTLDQTFRVLLIDYLYSLSNQMDMSSKQKDTLNLHYDVYG